MNLLFERSDKMVDKKIIEFHALTDRIPFRIKYSPFNLEDFLHYEKKFKEYALASDIWITAKNEDTKKACETVMQLVQMLKWKDYKAYNRPLIYCTKEFISKLED